ncbi:unnamed protein product [Choristocarpus tenellus]
MRSRNDKQTFDGSPYEVVPCHCCTDRLDHFFQTVNLRYCRTCCFCCQGLSSVYGKNVPGGLFNIDAIFADITSDTSPRECYPALKIAVDLNMDGQVVNGGAQCTSGKPGQRVIAIDLDEVLGYFVPQLCLFHNHVYGSSLTADDFFSYEFHEVWGGTQGESDRKMDAFFKSDFFLGQDGSLGIPVIEGALEVLQKFSPWLEFHIVTSRQHILENVTREWVSRNFPGVITDVHFGNHYGTSGEKRSKPDLCRAIAAELLIDDSLKYARQCSAAGIRSCLFGDYAWNRTDQPLPDNIERVLDWFEVEKFLKSIMEDAEDNSISNELAYQ